MSEAENDMSESTPSVPGFSTPKRAELKKQLGLTSAVSLICGTIIGTGIFLTPTDVVDRVGSIGMSLIVWTASGVLVMLMSLVYCELGTVMPFSGGEYVYLRRAFGNLPAFLYTWTSTFALRSISGGIITLTFARYLARPFFEEGCEPPELTEKLIAVSALIVISCIGCLSVKWAAQMQNLFFFIKLGVVAFIILLGFTALGQGKTANYKDGFNNTKVSVGTLGFAFYDCLWAYDGWNNMNYAVAEMKDPSQLPKAILIGIPLVIALYILINMAYFSILPLKTLLVLAKKEHVAVAVDAAEVMIGKAALVVVPLMVAMSGWGAANGTLFTGARLIMESARAGDVPAVLGLVHRKMLTPITAMAYQGVLAIFFVLVADVNQLILLFSVIVWTAYGASMAVVLHLRWKEPHLARPYRVHAALPAGLLVVCLFLVAAPFIQYPARSAAAIGFLLLGIPVYFIFVTRCWAFGCDRHFDWVSNALVRMVKAVLDVE